MYQIIAHGVDAHGCLAFASTEVYAYAYTMENEENVSISEIRRDSRSFDELVWPKADSETYDGPQLAYLVRGNTDAAESLELVARDARFDTTIHSHVNG